MNEPENKDPLGPINVSRWTQQLNASPQPFTDVTFATYIAQIVLFYSQIRGLWLNGAVTT